MNASIQTARKALCAAFAALLLGSTAVTERATAAPQNPLTIDGRARFTVIAPECIRMEYSASGEFVDLPSMFAVGRAARFDGFTAEESGGMLTIDTGKIRLTYAPDGAAFGPHNLKAEIRKGGGTAVWRPGMKNEANLGGTIRTVDGVYGPVDLGDGVLSRDGWFLLDDSRENLLTQDWVAPRPESAGTDWYLFGYGLDYKAALKALTKIGGPVPLPRKYSLGAWYSRYWAYTADEFKRLAEEYGEHDFPLDVMVLDMDWHKEGWTGWSWNRDLIPDPKGLLDWLHKQGLRVTLNVHPADGVGPHEDMYAEFMRALGRNPVSGERLLYDASDKKYLDALFQYTHAPHEEEGVDFWWLDWQQFQNTLGMPSLRNLPWLNRYYYNWSKRKGKRGQSFSRWGGWGDHRHPIHFSGDAHTGWAMLAFEVPFTSAAGNVGCFFWSHDIGGHMGGRNPESYTRWVQFGATTAALRSHSTKSAEMDRRPWAWPDWAEASMRKSFHLRSELFPYIYSSARQSTVESLPLNRPMYLEHPDSEAAYRNPQQYYFGDSLLAAPIASPGEGPKRMGFQTVWFPKGVWSDWFTGEKHVGEREILASADIDEFPLYARAGAPIPMQPYTPRMTSAPLAELVVRCYPGADGQKESFELYEDDGESAEYETGAFATTRLTCERRGDAFTLTVDPAKGSYRGQPSERAVVFEVPATLRARSAEANGAPASAEYDAALPGSLVRAPARSIREKTVVTLRADEANAREIKIQSAARRIAAILNVSLPRDASLETLTGAVARERDERKRALALKALGVGFQKKNEAVYRHGGEEKPFFHADAAVIDKGSLKVRVDDVSRAGIQPVAEFGEEGLTAGFRPQSLPPLPDPVRLGDGVRRIVAVDFEISGMPFGASSEIDRKLTHLTKWRTLGPFDFDRGKNLLDQTFVPEGGTPDLKAYYPGAKGQNMNWRKAAAENGTVDLNSQFYFQRDDSIAYAATVVASKTKQQILLRIDADDGVAAWLNGERIHVRDGERFPGADPDILTAVQLNPGPNLLFLKLSQYRNEWKFNVSVETAESVKEAYAGD